MKLLTIFLLGITSVSSVFADTPKNISGSDTYTPPSVSGVSPALENYLLSAVNQDLWHRTQLSPRDRSLVTVSVIVARNQTSLLRDEMNRALDNGLKPQEISEIITHLAFYSGLANATSASAITKEVFDKRGITVKQLPEANPKLLPLDEQAEAKRVELANKMAGSVSPGLVKYTTDVLFRSLWLRPDLSPRDRSLVTVSSLIANGQSGQIGFHLNKAMDNGVTREQIGETLAQIAFYAGWPNAFSAVSVVQDVFNSRAG